MKEIKDISKTLEDPEKRISELEKLMGKAKKSKVNLGKQSLSDYIIGLRDNKFFSQPKTAEEVHSKIIEKYPCELNRVAVALVRLSGKRKLRKASKIVNNKKYKAYVW